jgi:hypothetical protein
MNEQLLKDNEQLLKDNASLKQQLNNLNENTIIQSMNDMKKQYEELKQESVPIEMYEEICLVNRTLLKLTNTIEMINNLNTQKIFDISFNLKKFVNDDDVEDISDYMFLFDRDLCDLKYNSRLINTFINKNNDDNECCLEHY